MNYLKCAKYHVISAICKSIIMSCPHRVGHNGLTDIVCTFICPVPDPKSRMEGHAKLKINRKKAHDVGVHRPIYRLKCHRSR